MAKKASLSSVQAVSSDKNQPAGEVVASGEERSGSADSSASQLRKIEIGGRGRISRLDVPVPPAGQGGVVIIRGQNDHGKSTALSCVDSLINGGSGPSLRRGEVQGYTNGLGVNVKVGARITRKGKLEVTGFVGAESITKFVDPGIKDQDAADAERLRNLLRLANAKISGDAWAERFGQEVRELVKDDPVATSTAIVKHLQAKARESEAERDRREGAATALGSRVKAAEAELAAAGVELTASGVAAESAVASLPAGQDLAAAVKAHELAIAEKLKAERAVENRKAAAEEAKRAAEELKAEEGKALGTLDKAEAAFVTAEKELAERNKSLENLRKMLEEETAKQLAATTAWKAAKQTRDTIADHHATLNKLREKVASGAVEVDLTELNAAVAKVEKAAKIKTAIEQKAAIEKLRKDAAAERESAKKSSEQAAKYRQSAEDVDLVLADAIKGIACGVRISNGRLWAKNSEGVEVYVSELSPGRRTTIAIEIAASSASGGEMGVLEQEAWESLDPLNQEYVIRRMIEKGIVLVTAERDAGELRAECITEPAKELASGWSVRESVGVKSGGIVDNAEWVYTEMTRAGKSVAIIDENVDEEVLIEGF